MINFFNFRKKKALSIQGFGKLPFYKDYISMVSAPEALRWRDWLLERFGKKKWRMPLGKWPFVFQSSPQTSMIIGIMESGTDGIREFPFSLFLVFDDDGIRGQTHWKTMITIWENLKNIRNDMNEAKDIDSFYASLRSQFIPMHSKRKKEAEDNVEKKPDFFELFSDPDKSWPVFVIISDILKQKFIIHHGDEMADDFLVNWEGLNHHV